MIALSVCAAFAVGRLAGILASRFPRAARPVRIAVVVVSVAVAIFFLRSNASRYALLLPLALTAGTLTARSDPPATIF